MQLGHRTMAVAIAAGLAFLAVPLPATAQPASRFSAVRVAPQPIAYKVTAKGGVKARMGPGTQFRVAGNLKSCAVVSGTGKAAKRWIQVRLPNKALAWVPAKDLERNTPPSPKGSMAAYRVLANGVRVRLGPGLKFRVASTVNTGSFVAGIGRTSDGWTQVALSTRGSGWVASVYLTKTVAPVYKVAGTVGVNLRSGPGTGYTKVGFLKTGVLVPGTGKAQLGWAQVGLSTGGLYWASTRYLAVVAPKMAASPTASAPEDAPNPQVPAQPQPASEGPGQAPKPSTGEPVAPTADS